MTYQIEITRDALKTLAKLDKPIRRRLQIAIDQLAGDPRPAGAIALKGVAGYLRIRVADYRVIYRAEDGRLVVAVVAVGHGREINER
ncbi:type II toxin-antitoxin system RelE family toxin [Saccharopolyspora spinosa]|uniref:mRNA interferase RelE/StbE n=1 Tax=Saccharopolyspora spinosa TaxID=60894 RepID=A0A2N3Y8K3_SACSN|nr:type II toxin-antitoxin system RelE/ParE family toxin [Saccharopolyspora spinosa]PKW19264.1 mRNA interferase RelE/StbE [Saccharopolyspora spinosa]